MSKSKKMPSKQVTQRMPTNKRIIVNFPLKEWWLKKKKPIVKHKKIDKREKQRQLASCHMRLLTWDGVECIYVKCVSLVAQLGPS
jgi:uncharacterized membrane protein